MLFRSYNLLIAPWEIPGLDIDADLDALAAFGRENTTADGLAVTQCRYLLVARKQ